VRGFAGRARFIGARHCMIARLPARG
jgi:hypothetical protein